MIRRATIERKMATIVETTVEHYQTDFYDYDLQTLEDMESKKEYIWITRESGTHFSSDPDYIETITNYYGDGLRSAAVIKRVSGGYTFEPVSLKTLPAWIEDTKAREARKH